MKEYTVNHKTLRASPVNLRYIPLLIQIFLSGLLKKDGLIGNACCLAFLAPALGVAAQVSGLGFPKIGHPNIVP